MKIVTAEIYICQYCDKRFLSKSGCKKHESDYCRVRKEAEYRPEYLDVIRGFEEGKYYDQRKV